jgi:phospholipid transport system substrate-binding protein
MRTAKSHTSAVAAGIRRPAGMGRIAKIAKIAKISLFAPIALIALGQPGAHAEETKPVDVIESLHESLLSVMKDAKTLGYSGRYEQLGPVLESKFDLDFMGSKSLGRHWGALSEEEKQKWLEAFHRFTISNYASRFDGYGGETFKIMGSDEASHNTVVVRTEIFSPTRDGDMTRLNYRLRETPDGWRIIDVYLNGSVSELALRRAEFSTAYERKGFNEVLASLESKISALSSGRGA